MPKKPVRVQQSRFLGEKMLLQVSMLSWFVMRDFAINTNSAVIGFDLSFGSSGS